MFKIPYTWVALSPIKATDDMTDPVGQRDGRLFTSSLGRLPAIEEGDENKILIVDENGRPVWSGRLMTAEQAISELQAGFIDLDTGKQKEVFSIDSQLEPTRWVNKQVTLTVNNIRPTDILIIAPKPESYIEWCNCMVRAIAQATNTITFQCDVETTNVLNFTVVVIRPN